MFSSGRLPVMDESLPVSGKKRLQTFTGIDTCSIHLVATSLTCYVLRIVFTGFVPFRYILDYSGVEGEFDGRNKLV